MKFQKIVTVLTMGVLVIIEPGRLNQSIDVEAEVVEVNENEVYESEMNDTEVHESEVNGSEAHGAEANDAELHELEMHETEVNGSEVNRTEMNESEVSATEAGSVQTENVQTENLAAGNIENANMQTNDTDEFNADVALQHLGAVDAATSADLAGSGFAVPVTYEFSQVELTYFEDALFIGDSRTEGLGLYADLGEADVFASAGMNVYQLWDSKVEMKGEDGKELLTLDALLEQQDYNKIYITLGINEIGYHQETSIQKYEETIEKIREYEPNAIIFLQSNLHVSKAKSDKDQVYNNDKINEYNARIEGLADGANTFYLDCNVLFNDEEGNLREDYTYDGIHVYKKYYQEWFDWLCTRGIVK